jgi:hypothetical protein
MKQQKEIRSLEDAVLCEMQRTGKTKLSFKELRAICRSSINGIPMFENYKINYHFTSQILGAVENLENTGIATVKRDAWDHVASIELTQRGKFLGYNIQIIKRYCHTCCGSGNFLHWTRDSYDSCWHCNGTGIFRIDHVLLERYELFGDVYHRPVDPAGIERLGGIGKPIKGIIEHESIPYRRAALSFIFLLFMFNQDRFGEELKRFCNGQFEGYLNKLDRRTIDLRCRITNIFLWCKYKLQMAGIVFELDKTPEEILQIRLDAADALYEKSFLAFIDPHNEDMPF